MKLRRAWVCALFVMALEFDGAVSGAQEQNQTQVANDSSFVTIAGRKSDVFVGDCKQDDPLVYRIRAEWSENHQAGTLKRCIVTALFSVPVAYGNNFFGGTFIRGQDGREEKIEICFDDHVGHFATRIVSSSTLHDLLLFIVENCSKG